MKQGWLWIFPGIGALLLAGAVAVQVNRVSQQDSLTAAEGWVAHVVQGCPTIEFSTPDGESVQFRGGVCSSPPAYDVGERVRVLYPAASPASARLDSFTENWFVSLVLGGIGSVFLLIGLVFVLPPLLSGFRARDLAVTGEAVFAIPVDVQRNTSYSVNGQHPWRIIAQWQNPATGKVHLFRSNNLWFDPSRFVAEQKQIRVLIDPQKPKRYSMDVSFLPEVAD